MILFIRHVSDVGCVTASGRKQVAGAFAAFFFSFFFFSGHRCPVVAGLRERRQRGEAGWIDGTAAGPAQL